MSRIIVGVDGSHASELALAWAVSEARLRGDELEVVMIIEPGAHASDHSTPPPVSPSTFATRALTDREQKLRDERRRAQRSGGERALDRMLDKLDTSGVDIRPIVVADNRPARRLIDLSREAGVSHLVVGARGRGGFRELVLGSVGEQCVAYAACPVTVVRDTAKERGGR